MKKTILVFGDDFDAMSAFAKPLRESRERHRVLLRSSQYYQGEREHCDELFLTKDAKNADAIRERYRGVEISVIGENEPAAPLTPEVKPPMPPTIDEVTLAEFEKMSDEALRNYILTHGEQFGMRPSKHARRVTLIAQASNIKRAIEAQTGEAPKE